ncbi:MAG: hypothetical protein AB7I38_02100 [Dehalococcoidia bacterium]
MGLRGLLMTILSLIWVVILVLVGGRFLVLLVDANRDSEIVDRLIRHSDFWVKPFTGLFDLTNEAVESTGGVFEVASAIAFAFYFIVGLLIFALVNQASGWGPRYRGPVEG